MFEFRGLFFSPFNRSKDVQRVTAMTIDMTKPFHLPWCSRGSSDFRGRYVVRLHAGGAIMYAHNMNFILCHLPNISHSANSNITFLYWLLRWELYHPLTKAAMKLFIDWDGGIENTADTTMMFLAHVIKKRWRSDIETYRMVTKHSHSVQDQKFFVLRYLGYNTTLMTTNFAQALFKLMLGFKKNKESYCLLLLASEFDWDAYFADCINPSLKYWNRPLAWKYMAGNDESRGLPRVRVKTWGDAQKHWHGVDDSADGADILPYIKEPGNLLLYILQSYSFMHVCVAVADRPKKLPNLKWVTPKIAKDVEFLAGKYCSKEEQAWFKEVLQYSELTRIVWDGEEGDGGLPGRPGHFVMKDKAGYEWEAKVRVLGDLPEDLWALPADRSAAQDDVEMLSEQERLFVPRTSFVNDGAAPTHPAWMGARLLDEEEKRQHDFGDESRFPAAHLKVTAILAEDPTEAGLKKATVKELKSWLAENDQRRSGSKPILIQRVLSCFSDVSEQKSGAEDGSQERPAAGGRRRKRRRVADVQPLLDENLKSISESSSDESLIPQPLIITDRNRPHSAARRRVRRQFARVYGRSDEEREAAGLREQHCRSDLSDSSSEEWEPVNALRDLYN